jgi:hypothetical protein
MDPHDSAYLVPHDVSLLAVMARRQPGAEYHASIGAMDATEAKTSTWAYS